MVGELRLQGLGVRVPVVMRLSWYGLHGMGMGMVSVRVRVCMDMSVWSRVHGGRSSSRIESCSGVGRRVGASGHLGGDGTG